MSIFPFLRSAMTTVPGDPMTPAKKDQPATTAGLIESVGFALQPAAGGGDGMEIVGGGWELRFEVASGTLGVAVEVAAQIVDAKPGPRLLRLSAPTRSTDIDELLMWLGQIKAKLAQKQRRDQAAS